MITIENYEEKKDTINWGSLPTKISSIKTDIEDMIEFYGEDDDITKAINLFLKGINDAVSPVKKEDLKPNKVKAKELTLQDAFLDAKLVRVLMPKAQQMAVLDNDESEEVQFFIDKVKELETNFVKAANHQPIKRTIDAIIYAHYFYGNTHWYVSELELKNDEFFGYVILNGDTQNSEAGYSSIAEILSIKGVELDFYFNPTELGKILHKQYPKDFEAYKKIDVEPTKEKAKAAPKSKITNAVDKTIVDNFSAEFLLIRRFWNVIKSEKVKVPFRTVQLLYMAFNKAAVERKVRKASENSVLFENCNKKIVVLFENFENPEQKPYEVDFKDKELYSKIQNFVTGKAINPAIAVLKRMISIQNTKPEVKKVVALLKSVNKLIDNDKNNRLLTELNQAKKALEQYIATPKSGLEPRVYGLSVPRSVCTNRVKCAGIDKTGKLHKGYKFQEKTGAIVRVRAVATKKRKVAKKPTSKKKRLAGLGFLDNKQFDEVERIYVDAPPVIHIIPQPFLEQEQKQEPIQTKVDPEPETSANTKGSKNKLMNMQFDGLDLDEGWENFMQYPSRNMKIAIYGKPKNGKTAGSLQLASYLTKFGNILYNFVDQGFSKSTQDLWKMSGLANKTNAEPGDFQTLDELEKEVATGKHDYVFIDMISDYINNEGIKHYEFKERFIKKYPKVSFILIFEATKGGDFKGDQGWTHIVDAVVEVKDFLMENRGRYGVGSHIVWEEGLKKFNPKKYEEIMEELAPEPALEFTEVERI